MEFSNTEIETEMDFYSEDLNEQELTSLNKMVNRRGLDVVIELTELSQSTIYSKVKEERAGKKIMTQELINVINTNIKFFQQEDEIEALKNDIKSLEEERDSIDSDLRHVTYCNESLAQENRELLDKIDKLEALIANSPSLEEYQDMQTRVRLVEADQNQEMQQLLKDNEERIQTKDKVIAELTGQVNSKYMPLEQMFQMTYGLFPIYETYKETGGQQDFTWLFAELLRMWDADQSISIPTCEALHRDQSLLYRVRSSAYDRQTRK